MKKKMYKETAYLLGLVLLALGTVMTTRGEFGVGMVVAPAYVCYLAVSQWLPWFTFGMAEYLFQGLLLTGLCLFLGRFRFRYLWSAVTVLLYGLVLDLGMAVIPAVSQPLLRAVCYVSGLAVTPLGVAFMFHTYIPPAIYELVVAELSRAKHWPLPRVKTLYDCASCALAVILSLAIFGRFEGVSWGTVACALVNGTMIGAWGKLLEKHLQFTNGTRLYEYLG